jgi:hypothetical protein
MTVKVIESSKMPGVVKYLGAFGSTERLYQVETDDKTIYCVSTLDKVNSDTWKEECGRIPIPDEYTVSDIVDIYGGLGVSIVFEMSDGSYYTIASYDIPSTSEESAELERVKEADKVSKLGEIVKILYDKYDYIYLMDDGYLYKYGN